MCPACWWCLKWRNTLMGKLIYLLMVTLSKCVPRADDVLNDGLTSSVNESQLALMVAQQFTNYATVSWISQNHQGNFFLQNDHYLKMEQFHENLGPLFAVLSFLEIGGNQAYKAPWCRSTSRKKIMGQNMEFLTKFGLKSCYLCFSLSASRILLNFCRLIR